MPFFWCQAQAQYVGPQPTTFVFVQACEEHDQQGPGTPEQPVLYRLMEMVIF